MLPTRVNWTRTSRHHLGCAALALVHALAAAEPVGAQSQSGLSAPGFAYETNLVQNPNADEGPFQNTFDSEPPVEIQGWTDGGPMSVLFFCNAPTTGGDLTPCFDPGDEHVPDSLPSFKLFAGGVASSGSTSISQVLASPPPADADSGRIVFELSGWLGGVGTQDDSMTVTLTFEDGTGSPIGQATLGPVLAADRGDESIVVFRKTFGRIPAGTRGMSIELVADHASGTVIDGYATLLSLSLTLLDEDENWLTASDAKPFEAFGTALAAEPDTIVVGRPAYARTNQFAEIVAIDREGAVYVFEKNPSASSHEDEWPQVARLSSFKEDDGFGENVAISNDYLAVSADSDDDLPTLGAVHIFERDLGGPGNWGLAQKVRPDMPWSFADVGRGLSFSGALLAVGNPLDHVDVNQDPMQPPNFVPGLGSVRLFSRDAGGPGQWSEIVKVDGVQSSRFGQAVALDGDTLAVGLPGWIRFCCPQIDAMGQVHVFERNQGGPDNWGVTAVIWSPTWDLEPDDFASDGAFGDLVALEGDTLVVGGPATLSDATFSVYDRNTPGAAPGETRDVWGRVRVVSVGRVRTAASDRIPLALEGDRVAATLDDGLHVFERNEGGAGQWGEVTNVALPNAPFSLALRGELLALGYTDDDLAGTDAGLVVVDEATFAPQPAAATTAVAALFALACLVRVRRCDSRVPRSGAVGSRRRNTAGA